MVCNAQGRSECYTEHGLTRRSRHVQTEEQKAQWRILCEEHRLEIMAEIPERVDRLQLLGKQVTPLSVWQFLGAKFLGFDYYKISVEDVADYLWRHELTQRGPRQKPPKTKFKQLSLF
jgi:hypothetical protein